MSESYMKKGLEAQKPTEVMAEGAAVLCGRIPPMGHREARRGHSPDPGRRQADAAAAGGAAGPEHAQNVRCALPEFLGYWDTECEEKIKKCPGGDANSVGAAANERPTIQYTPIIAGRGGNVNKEEPSGYDLCPRIPR